MTLATERRNAGYKPTMARAKNSDTDAEMRVGFRMAGLGMEVAGQVAAGALLGWLYDKWQGTSPNGVLYGGVIGIIVGMWTLIRGALKLNRALDQSHPTKGRGRPIPTMDDDDDNDDWNRDNDAGDSHD